MASQSAVFIDRDGTIIEDTNYIRDPKDVKLIPGAALALREMSQKGYLVFVISNQAGVAKGLIRDTEFWEVHLRVCELLMEEQVKVEEFLYCFHHPQDGCACRKPRAGLVPKVHHGEKILFEKSFTIGDKEADVLLADTIGATGCLVLTGQGKEQLERLKHRDLTRYKIANDLSQMAGQLPDLSGKVSP